jgi:hypothetical protein
MPGYSLLGGYQCFGRKCLHLQDKMSKAGEGAGYICSSPENGSYKRTCIRSMDRGELSQDLTLGTTYLSSFTIRQWPLSLHCQMDVSLHGVHVLQDWLLSAVHNILQTRRGAHRLSCSALFPKTLHEEADNCGAVSQWSYNWLLKQTVTIVRAGALNTALALGILRLQNQNVRPTSSSSAAVTSSDRCVWWRCWTSSQAHAHTRHLQEHQTFCYATYTQALCYKPEGRGFDSRWGEFLNLPNLSCRTRPWGLLSL